MKPGSTMNTLFLALLLSGQVPSLWAASLAEVVQKSVERHPRYSYPQALRKVEAGYRQQAESLLGGDPSVNVSAAGDSMGSDFGYEEYVAGISMPVALPGQRSARHSIAEKLAAQADRELARLTWEVSGEVLDRAWRLKITRAEMKQALKQWAAARALEKDIAHRYEAGELTRNDLLLARQDVVDTESAYQEAVNLHQQARQSWVSYTGLHELPDDLERFARLQLTPALSRHPRLQAVLANSETAHAKVNDSRQQRRASPVVSLYAKHDRGARGEDYTDSLGIEFSIPLGTRAQAAPAIAEAEAELTSVQAEAMLVKRELELGIANAEQELAKAEQLLQLARKKHEYAHTRLLLAQRAFELGEMDLFQLLLARQQSALAAKNLEIRDLEKQQAMAKKNHLLGVVPQ